MFPYQPYLLPTQIPKIFLLHYEEVCEYLLIIAIDPIEIMGLGLRVIRPLIN